TKRFLLAIAPLSEAHKLGALLLQLSPSFSPLKHRLDQLDHLLGLLDGYRVAVELRNRSWVDADKLDSTAAFYKKHRIAFVGVDAPPGEHFMIMPSLDLVTTPQLAYLRAHGRNTRGYVRGRALRLRLHGRGAGGDRPVRHGPGDASSGDARRLQQQQVELRPE